MWAMEYTHLSRLRDSACTGMRAKCISFFGPLYGPSKGQHTLYRLFNGPAVCLLLLENSVQINPHIMLNLVGLRTAEEQNMHELF